MTAAPEDDGFARGIEAAAQAAAAEGADARGEGAAVADAIVERIRALQPAAPAPDGRQDISTEAPDHAARLRFDADAVPADIAERMRKAAAIIEQQARSIAELLRMNEAQGNAAFDLMDLRKAAEAERDAARAALAGDALLPGLRHARDVLNNDGWWTPVAMLDAEIARLAVPAQGERDG